MAATLIGNIYIDAVQRMTTSSPLKVTSHPIEDKSLVADYVVEEDVPLVFEVTFTDDNLVYAGVNTLAAKAASRLTTATDKKQAVYKLHAAKEVIDIVMTDDFFDSMLLTDIQRDVTANNSKAFQATLVFQKVKTVRTGTTSIPADRLAKKSAAKQTGAAKQSEEADKGKTPAPEVTQEEKTNAARSLAKTVFS